MNSLGGSNSIVFVVGYIVMP